MKTLKQIEARLHEIEKIIDVPDAENAKLMAEYIELENAREDILDEDFENRM